VNQKLSELRSY